MYYKSNIHLQWESVVKWQKGELKNESKIPKIRNKFKSSAS